MHSVKYFCYGVLDHIYMRVHTRLCGDTSGVLDKPRVNFRVSSSVSSDFLLRGFDLEDLVPLMLVITTHAFQATIVFGPDAPLILHTICMRKTWYDPDRPQTCACSSLSCGEPASTTWPLSAIS